MSVASNSSVTSKVSFVTHQEPLKPVVIDHILTMPLPLDSRVGFSILNLTGYPIRFLQFWENGNIRTLQYLDSGQRGLLNFIASKTLMRDNDIIEVQFNAQRQLNKLNNRKGAIGHYVSLQMAGYKWLRNIQADTLGIKFEDIHPVLGLMDLRKAYPNNLEIQQTVKLVTEVRQQNGGRVLQLNSVFILKNSTFHPLQLLTNESSNINIAQEDLPFVVAAGEAFYVPLALLYRSIVKSKANSLGYIWLKPLDAQPIVEELGISPHTIGEISYTIDPINLMKTVRTTLETTSTSSASTGLHSLTAQQLSCKLSGAVEKKQKLRSPKYGSTRNLFSKRDERYHPPPDVENNRDQCKLSHLSSTRIFNYDMLPAFCYNIEIESLSNSTLVAASPPLGNLSETMSDTDGSGSKGATDRTNKNVQARIYSIGMRRRQSPLSPSLSLSLSPSLLILLLVIHPPIILENLLPVPGTFELIAKDDPNKTVLWSAIIEPGKSKPVHTVAMDSPLLLLINLDFCRSSDGVLIHTPINDGHSRTLADAVYRTIEGLRGLIEENETQSSILLTDTVGQRLRLHIQNDMGGGGQRNIVIFCPYWVINTSQYTLRLKEEGTQSLPAGTLTAQRDGRVPLKGFHQPQQPVTFSLSGSKHHHDDFLEVEEKVYPGSPGPLHSSKVREIEIDSPLQSLLSDLNFDQIMLMSSMFNFFDGTDSKLIGSQKVIAQLDDSNWSSSFTLESVGVNQVLSVDHSEKGMLELSFKISSAPGKLAVYTKIIRFSPRFVVVNKLPVLAQIIQVNGFLHEKVPIQVSPGFLKPFHLPAVFGERQVALDIDGPWLRSVSFAIDNLGSYTLRIKKYIDPSSLEHIMTRGTPEYDVTLPPGEVGIWFETDWDHQQIVVMKIRKGSVAATRTDIQEGDVLLRIDGELISRLSFDTVMDKLRKSQQLSGATLTFQTVEEKMRLIRIHAMLGQGNGGQDDFTHSHLDEIHLSRHLSRHLPQLDDNSHLSLPHGTHVSLSSKSDGHSVAALTRSHGEQTDINQESIIQVQMKSVDSSIFMIISEPDKNIRPEYQIINLCCGYSLHYRQKGMYGARWSILDPGDSIDYVFDDPTKSRSIIIRVGKYFPCLSQDRLTELPTRNEHPLGCLSVNSSDIFVAQVLFDEIGSKSVLSIPQLDKRLEISVNSNGPTKLLSISSETMFQECELQYTLEFLKEQILLVTNLLSDLREIKIQEEDASDFPPDLIERLLDDYVQVTKVKQERCIDLVTTQYFPSESPAREQFLHGLTPFRSMLGPTITKTNQILVEILQATGLRIAPLGGTDESFCEVSLKCANFHFG
jgi:hypothetical protein